MTSKAKKVNAPSGLEAIALKDDRDSRALVTFLKHLGDDVELMRIWARSADESTLTGLYDKFVGLAEEMNEKDDTPLDAILAALLIAVCTIANSNDYSKATVLKAVYEIPWPAYNAPGGSGVN